MATTTELNALAQELYMPKFTTNFGDQAPALRLLMQKGKKLDGGTKIRHSAIYQYNKGGAFTRGTVFDTSGEQNAQYLELTWRYYYWPVTIFLQDELEIAGASKIHDIMTVKFAAARMGAEEMLSDHLFSGGGTDSSTIINELDHALDNTSGTLSGSATYAGLSKGTETWFGGNVTDLGGADDLVNYANVQKVFMKAVDGGIAPDLGIAHTQSVLYYMVKQQGQQQYVTDTPLSAGFRLKCFHNGVPIVADNHVPIDTSTGYTTNRIYFINSDFINMFSHENLNMKLRPWMEPYDQGAKTAQIMWAGNLLVTDPRRHSVGYNFDLRPTSYT